METPMRILPALMFTLCALPADLSRAGGADSVLEVVSFRLTQGTTDAAFLAAARATEAPLRRQPGFLSRQLTRTEDGIWTDHFTWASLPQALSAAEAMMAEPAFGPFVTLIDAASIQMRHDTILWRMD
jgi:hypothetical protein